MNASRIWATLDPFFENGPILGRTQANAAFLATLLDLDPLDAYHFFPPSKAACRDLETALRQGWPGLWERGKFAVTPRTLLPRALARCDYHAFHLSDCMLNPGFLACLRNALCRKIFPITSTTHSLSYARYGQDFLKHLQPGATSRDVVVATSRTAQAVVEAYYDTLRQAYGLSTRDFPQPRVERIPLGVDLDRFRPPDSEARAGARAAWGFGEETVFLVLARLSHSSKMDFLPILRAFHRLYPAGAAGAGVRLVLAGWTDEADWGRSILADLAANIGLPLTVAERPDEAAKLALYQAADVFLSPADNPQETFGLTLLEAQAAGLPVIASDFDGYRDLVRHETTGLLVPTTGLGDSASLDRIAPLLFDNHAHLLLAQRLAVDVPGLARALGRLAGDGQLRRAMGAAARENALSFSWKAVVERHLALWERLWTEPEPVRPAAEAHPMAVAYARVFAAYPTALLADADLLRRTRLGRAVYEKRDFPVIHEGLSEAVEPETLRALLVLARKPATAGDLAERLVQGVLCPDAEAARALLVWCLKHDLLERARDPA